MLALGRSLSRTSSKFGMKLAWERMMLCNDTSILNK